MHGKEPLAVIVPTFFKRTSVKVSRNQLDHIWCDHMWPAPLHLHLSPQVVTILKLVSSSALCLDQVGQNIYRRGDLQVGGTRGGPGTQEPL